MHISDFNGIRGGYYIRPILHPGEGVTDFERFFELFRNYNDTITLESPVMSEDGLDIEKLNKSLEYLKNKTSK